MLISKNLHFSVSEMKFYDDFMEDVFLSKYLGEVPKIKLKFRFQIDLVKKQVYSIKWQEFWISSR